MSQFFFVTKNSLIFIYFSFIDSDSPMEVGMVSRTPRSTVEERLTALEEKLSVTKRDYKKEIADLKKENARLLSEVRASKKREARKDVVIDNVGTVLNIIKYRPPAEMWHTTRYEPSDVEVKKVEHDYMERSVSRRRRANQGVRPPPPVPREQEDAGQEPVPAAPLPPAALEVEGNNLATPANQGFGGTPRTRTRAEILSHNLKPSSFPLQLKRKLELANAVMDAFARKVKHGSPNTKRVCAAILSSSPIAKSRVGVTMKEMGIPRRTLFRYRGKKLKDVLKKRVNDPEKTRRYKEMIGDFLERDDNSRMTADRNLKYKYPDRVVQRRVLTDYTRPLHKKFSSEFPDITVSLTTFRKYRPPHIALSRDLKARSCLCEYCENTRLLLGKLAQLTSERVPLSPHEFCELYEDGAAVNRLLRTIKADRPGNRVCYKKWKKVECEILAWVTLEDGTVAKRPKKVTRTLPAMITVTLPEFKAILRDSICDWREHEARYNHQFEAMREMREKMRANQIEIQCDFAEDYTCQVEAGQVQGMHWNSPKIMLHPMVMRYKEHDDGPILVKSFVYASEIAEHNSEMIWAILRQFWSKDLPETMGPEFMERIESVNYVSDSTYSQYRNRFGFFFLSAHHIHFGVRATWNFLETGHGKGACDGVGGRVKRIASEAGRHGHMISGFDSFWLFMDSLEETKIIFRKITPETFQRAFEDIAFLRTIPMRSLGIAHSCHAVKMGANRQRFSITWRHLSCACDACIDDRPMECPRGNAVGCEWDTCRLFVSTDVARLFRARVTCGRCRIFCLCNN